MPKAEFVRGLQSEDQPLSPYEISQRIRRSHGCVAVYQIDRDLPSRILRGYMVRWAEKKNRSPENPELYSAIVAGDQSLAWQHVVMTKEILHILDPPDQRTKDKQGLAKMLGETVGDVDAFGGSGLNVIADRLGFTLALGSAIPGKYRQTLRKGKPHSHIHLADLERLLNVPSALISLVLDPQFEDGFERALSSVAG